MGNFDNVRFPPIPKDPEHVSLQGAYMVIADTAPTTAEVKKDILTLDINTPLTVLEECIGFNGLWDKVINYYTRQVGFIHTDKLVAVPEAKPSIRANTNPVYLPDSYGLGPNISWHDERVNDVFNDDKRGLYCVSYDTNLEKVDKPLPQFMRESLIKGLSIIFSDLNKEYDEDYVASIQEKYYLFATAEEIYIPMRSCTTIRVLVTVPKRYIQSSDIKSLPPNKFPLGFFDPQNPNNIKNIVDRNNNDSSDPKDPPPPEPPNYYNLVFNSYKEYSDHFGEIESALGSLDIMYKSRKWMIDPESYNLSPIRDRTLIHELKDKIDIFILSNIDLKKVQDTTNLTNFKKFLKITLDSPYKGMEKTCQNFYDYYNFLSAKSFGFGSFFDREPHWEGKFVFKIHKKDKNILLIEFYDKKGERVKLYSGLMKFLNSEHIKNVTLSNFLLQRKISKLKKQFVEKLREKYNISALSFNPPQVSIDDETLVATKQEVISSFSEDDRAIFEDQEVSTWVNGVLPSTPASDTFPVDFANSMAGIGDAFKNTANLFNDEEAKPSGPEAQFSNWITTYYFPRVNSILAEPLNVTQCVTTAIEDAKALKAKTEKAIADFNKVLKQDMSNQKMWEGDDVKVLLADFPFGAKQKSFRILFGLEPMPKDATWNTKINIYVDAMKDLDLVAVIAELISCSTAKLDPVDFIDLLKKYNKAKKILEDLMYATLCNPFLGAAMKAINGIQLPQLPMYDPNRSLRKELERFFVKAIEDLILLSMREMLKALIKACLSDGNKEKGGSVQSPEVNNGNPLLDSLANLKDDADDSPINSLLSDLMDLNPNDDSAVGSGTAGMSSEQIKNQLRNKLKDFMDNLMCLLTLAELCKLLKGETVESEVYEEIIRVARIKYPELQKKVSTQQDVKKLFLIIAKSIGEEKILQMCPDTNEIPENSVTCGCDDGTLRAARNAILSGKGLPEEAIDAILNDMKEQEKKNVEDVLKFLNSDEPFDLSKFPSALCSRGPNGDLRPGVSDFSLPIKTFKGMMESLTKDIYDAFDRECTKWPYSAYSTATLTLSPLKFNAQTGKIETTKVTNPKLTTPEIPKIILPSYTFKNIFFPELPPAAPKDPKSKDPDPSVIRGRYIDELMIPLHKDKYKNDNKLILDDGSINKAVMDYNSNYNKIDSANTYTFNLNDLNVFIVGKKQESLDANLIDDALRTEVNKANMVLKNFINNLFRRLEGMLATSAVKEAVSAFGSMTDMKSLGEYFKDKSSEFPDLVKNLGILDDFARTPKNGVDEQKYKDFTKQFGGNVNADYLENSGVSIYLNVMAFLISKDSQLRSFISMICKYLDPDKPKPGLIEKSLIDEWEKQVKPQYEKVSKYYQVVFNTTLRYPNFDIKYNDNLQDVKDTNGNPVKLPSDKIYDFSKIEVLKNSKTILDSEDFRELDDDLVTYIRSLGIKSSNPTKEQVFDAYIRALNPNYLTENKNENNKNPVYPTYSEFCNEFFKHTLNSIKNNPFLKAIQISKPELVTVDNDDEDEDKRKEKPTKKVISQPNFQSVSDYLVLKLEQTPRQKACKIRPHYLDIDNLVKDAVESKKNSVCIEQIDEKIQNNEPVNTEEMENLETSDSQNIILTAIHRLNLRLHVDEVVLRGIPVFGYYDPQILKDNSLFVDYIAAMVEKEIKLEDELYFNLMTAFFLSTYNATQEKKLEDNILNRRKVLKNIILDEIKKHSLSKLTKRILDDTNKRLTATEEMLNNTLKLPQGSLKVNLNRFNDLTSLLDQLKIIQDSKSVTQNDANATFAVYEELGKIKIKKFQQEVENKQKVKVPIYKTFVLIDDKKSNIKDYHLKYRLLFDYLFPIKNYISLLFISAATSALVKPETLNIFSGTRASIRQTGKIVQSNGQVITPDLNNPQELENSDPMKIILSFILEMVFKTPIKIVKGFIEIADPNVALSSGVYKVAKAFEPNLHSAMIPAIGLPLGFWFLSPFMYNPLNLVYYGLGLWYEENDSSSGTAKEKQDALKNAADMEADMEFDERNKKMCENEKNPDAIMLNNKEYYRFDGKNE